MVRQLANILGVAVLLSSAWAQTAPRPVLAPRQVLAPRPVLMISIDGMRPDSVTHADEHGLKIPVLRQMLRDGVHAEGVQGVFPTVTYPSHTTLVTGVWPAVHGIWNNTRFDPERHLDNAWYWYAQQIHVSTLWQAAHDAGLRTGSVGWPVTVGASAIDDLVPEFWRGSSAAGGANPDDELMIAALTRPEGELARIRQRTGTPYMNGNATTLEGDRAKTVYALDILRQHKPHFMAIHLSSLDEEEHLHGPFSPEANADLETLDEMVGELSAEERKLAPDAVVVVVSDHGFAPVEHAVNLFVPFIQAGLMTVKTNESGQAGVSAWKAAPWFASGMAAVVLHDPGDAATRAQVRALADQLAADPTNGIAGVLGEEELRARGGFPDAVLAILLRPGYTTGARLTGPLVGPTAVQGTHGYDPLTVPEMRASFFAVGAGLPPGKSLGVVDMRQVAPTVAGWLGVRLPAAGQPTLSTAP